MWVCRTKPPSGRRPPGHRDLKVPQLFYPEIIAMNCLLSSPRWCAVIRSAHPEQLGRLHQEVGRCLGQRYEPTGISDAFVLWSRAQHRASTAPMPAQ
jgi:hypothetical protein